MQILLYKFVMKFIEQINLQISNPLIYYNIDQNIRHLHS